MRDEDPKHPNDLGTTASVGENESWLRSVARVEVLPARDVRDAAVPLGAALVGGRLLVKRRIGAGGMGAVYEAFDHARRTPLALKTLLRLDAAGIYRLKGEFRALAGVAHPNLVRLHELFADGERWFFTMELVDGERFDRWVRPPPPERAPATERTRLDEGRLRAVLSQLVAAVGAIHAAGKLHRDLKPSNVLVTPEGRVVVLDFGLVADPEPGGIGQTMADDSASGTPAYMAPEQAAGRPATAASDLYALGVMLFEALTGRLPFEGSAGEILAAKQRESPAPVRAFASSVPADLERACAQLLSRDPGERPTLAMLSAQLVQGSSTVEPQRAPGREVELSLGARPPLLGRDAELSRLRQAHALAVSGKTCIAVVSGESGIGKTALVEAFLSELRAEGESWVLSGRCYERESLPFKAFDAVVDEISRRLRRLDREAAALLPREVSALATQFPVLQRVAVVAEAPRRQASDAEEVRRRAFAAFGELVARIADRTPPVVAIDDLQWVDHDSTALLRYLFSHPEPAPGLVVLSHRSEAAADGALLGEILAAAEANAALCVEHITLGALDERASAQLAARQLGGARDAALAHTIAREAAGSPFFIGEVARAARHGTGAAHPTLGDAIVQHVASLQPSTRALLEVLAVAGRPLDVQLALDAAGASHDALDVLRQEQLARGASTGEGRGVECYHDRIRESVSASLPPAALRAVHARVAALLSQQPDADPTHLAVHCEGAGEHAAAAQHAVAAAERAAQKLAFDRAAQLYDRALSLGAFDTERERLLRIALGDALAGAGRGGEAADAFSSAAKGAPAALALDLQRRAAEHLLLSGHVDRGRALLDSVLRALGLPRAETHGGALAAFLWQRALMRLRGLDFRERTEGELDADQLLRADAAFACAQGFSMTDNVRGATYQALSLRLALRAGELTRIARAMALEYGFVGRLGPREKERSDALHEHALQLAKRVGGAAAHGYVDLMRSITATCHGRFAEAAEAGDAAARALREGGQRLAFERTTARSFQAFGLVLRGQMRELSELVPAVVEECGQRNDVYGVVTLSSGWPNQAWLVRDDPDEAGSRLRAASRLWVSSGYHLQSLYLLIGHSNLAFYRGAAAGCHERFALEWAPLQRSQLFRVPIVEALARHLRGHAAVAAARAGSGGAAPGELLRIAEGDAAAEARLGFTMSPALAASIRAAIACARGDQDSARRELERAVSGFGAADMTMYAAAHRRRLGALLGGDEGQQLVDEATAAMRVEAVVDPERMTEVLAPGAVTA